MKKTFIPLILLSTIALTGCNSNQEEKTNNENAVINNLNNSEISYVYAGVSSLDILDEDTSEDEATDEGQTSTDEVTYPSEGMDEGFGQDDIDLDTAKKYLAMYDKLTSEDALKIVSAESDKEEYVYKVVISTTGDEETKTFFLYYNEIVIDDVDDSEVSEDPKEDIDEPTLDDDKDDVDITVDVDVNEARKQKHHNHKHEHESTLLDGEIIDGEKSYSVKGSRIVGKYATRTRFVTKLDNVHSVSFSQTTSDEFTSYTYRLVENMSFGFFGNHHIAVSEYNLINYLSDDYNGVYFSKYENGEFLVYNFSSFVIDEQEYIEIVYFDDFKEFGYVYAKVNYDEEGNKTYEYLYSKSEIAKNDHDFWFENDDEFEREDDFKDHHGHHEKDHIEDDFGKDHHDHDHDGRF